MKTEIVILRGRWRGRRGWVHGCLAERRSRGVTKALVFVDGAPPELLALSSLAAARLGEASGEARIVQGELFAETKTPPAMLPAAS